MDIDKQRLERALTEALAPGFQALQVLERMQRDGDRHSFNLADEMTHAKTTAQRDALRAAREVILALEE